MGCEKHERYLCFSQGKYRYWKDMSISQAIMGGSTVKSQSFQLIPAQIAQPQSAA